MFAHTALLYRPDIKTKMPLHQTCENSVGTRKLLVIWDTISVSAYPGTDLILFHSGSLPNTFQLASCAAMFSNISIYVRLGRNPPMMVSPKKTGARPVL